MFLPLSSRFVLIISVIGLLLGSSMALAADQPVTSPRLQEALGDNDFAWRNADGQLTVWVFFQDKGLSGPALQTALDAAEANLSQRTAWRRGKVKAAGERLVDTGDLPVYPSYLQQIEATGAVLRRESRWLNAASFLVTNEQAEALKSMSFVRKTDLVARFQHRPIPSLEPIQTNDGHKAEDASLWSINYGNNLPAMEQASVPAVHEMGINGQGVIIGMLDSGFHYSHEALAGIPVLGTYDFVNDDENVDNEPGDPSNSKNHGTMTMSTAVGNMPGQLVAPAFGASVVLAKTEDVSQEVPIEEDQWVAGLEWVETFGVDIVSSSLGYLDWYSFSDMDGNTAVTTLAADLAVGRGIVVINSAGNERGSSWNHIIAPADGFNVITVGAVDSSDDISYFSSPGPSYDGRIKPDVSALGVSNTVVDPDDDSGYTTASGTSFSCPLTSGVAALVLSRAPNLTPDQVREALRETASMAQSPNNDFGWGIINAYEAVQYFGPSLIHTPLTDTESTENPYSVSALITDRVGVDAATLYYRLDSGSWQSVAMNTTGDADTYAADIPAQSAGAVIDYYLVAASDNGVETNLPAMAPTDFFTFHVGPDVTAPQLAHTPLIDQAIMAWPPTLRCVASDNLGLDHLEMVYQLNGGPVMGPYLFNADGDDNFSLVFPLLAGDLVLGDNLSYTITAYDIAKIPNQSVNGPNGLVIIDALGLVLILDDGTALKSDQKYDDYKQLITSRDDGKSNANTMADWLTAAGYVADVMDASAASLESFQPYQLVVLSAGDNAVPVETATLRTALQDWANAGGKLLIEGGEIGYDALSNPGYPEFAAQVLHASGWDGDLAGDLEHFPGMENHPVLNSPHLIDAVVDVTYSGYGDQDAVEPDAESYLVMNTSSNALDAGVLIYDNNLAPQSAQIVYFAFSVGALSGDAGEHLTLNAAQFLLAAESAPTGSISGSVNLAGQSNHSGVLVTAGNGISTVTGSDGSWTIPDLYGGLYDLLFTKEDWGTTILSVELGSSEHLINQNVTMLRVFETDYEVTPGMDIPDNTPGGITSYLTVPANEAGIISGVTVDVDISHSWIGDLTIQLISPTGVVVKLQDRSGGSSDDLVGNWPETLEVAGPGSLNDYIGISNAGDWILLVADHVGSDTGVLNSWGLHFIIPGNVSGVDESSLPSVTRLNTNVPNPFNPMTKISFDLAQSGAVRLGIFDLRGRLVRRLVNEQLSAGVHTVRWDGVDDVGRSVSSGVYLYRLESSAGVQERKMVLVR